MFPDKTRKSSGREPPRQRRRASCAPGRSLLALLLESEPFVTRRHRVSPSSHFDDFAVADEISSGVHVDDNWVAVARGPETLPRSSRARAF